MKTAQNKTLNAYERVLSFLSTYASLLGTIPQMAAVSTLTAVVAALSGNAGAQSSTASTKGGITNQIKTMRAALVKTMRSIAATATDARATVTGMPTFTPPEAKTPSAKLIQAATGMVDALTPFEQTFITAGFASTFLTDLATATAQLVTAVTAQGTAKGQRVGATTAVASGLRQARNQVKILDPLVQQALTGNEPVLAYWKNIKRVSPKPSTSTPAATPTTTTDAPDAAHPAAESVATHTSTPEAKAA